MGSSMSQGSIQCGWNWSVSSGYSPAQKQATLYHWSQVPAKLRGQLACMHSVKPTFLLRVAVRKRPPGNNPCRDYCLHLLNHAWRLLVTVGQRQLQPSNSNNKGGVPRPKNVPNTISFPQTFPSGDIQTEHIQRTQVLDGDFSKVFASWLS